LTSRSDIGKTGIVCFIYLIPHHANSSPFMLKACIILHLMNEIVLSSIIIITSYIACPIPIGTAIPLGSNKTIGTITRPSANNKTQTDSVTFAASILK
jgi:hypothetical protein